MGREESNKKHQIIGELFFVIDLFLKIYVNYYSKETDFFCEEEYD